MTSGAPEVRREARDLGKLPLLVITGGPKGRADWHPRWLELQRELAGMSEAATQVYAEHTGHHVHLDDERFVVEMIRGFVAKIRGVS